ncbi:hypothetical protein PMI15_02938 [Polaromonas sp. CF318]|uniref:T6SS phospholipase effector Tle1-like catalytic domain-containing protein n=1 Tax=Polaromonas sp. CF318 TaxID=1144318 RepID=UPI00027144BE|nr:DUF2235 domain-containing protein [Polaromonas sp. CF318]EJL82708.1 hypothetical protein PMI15_02938 [Polaromonas sp. CF318]
MNRQLIICCDGTNNNLTGGARDTNVTKLCGLLAPDDNDQLLYYDPGVGNPGELPGASLTDSISRIFERLHGLAFGKGVYENIAEAYVFLMRNYRPGDQIFLFGFSRGAFTARSIGGLVTQFGLLRPEMEGLVPTLLHVYFSDRERGGRRYTAIRDQISRLFASEQTRAAPVWFVGVWETVSSVGAPLLSRTITASPTIVGKRFHHVRQALALDEYRRSFEPRPYYVDPAHDYAAGGQSIAQLWFSGAHCDVGGGYAQAEARLSRDPLFWMLQEAGACQLRLRAGLVDAAGQLDTQAVLAALAPPTPGGQPPQPRIHSQTYTTALWALAGLQQRNPHVVLDAGKPQQVVPLEHPSVAALGLSFPADTVWARRRPVAGLLVALALAVAFWLLVGGLLNGGIVPARMTLWECLLALGRDAGQAAAANLTLARWQIDWVASWAYPLATLPQPADRVAGAVWADFGLIAAYACILARAVTWAFARIVRVQRAGHRPPALLNALGLAAMTAVLGDIAENLLTLALVSAFPWPLLAGVEPLLGLAMTVAALAKWVGLLGCGALFLWGLGARSR